jgi:predicted DNA-binding transcriptional regulator YafY
MANSKHAHYRFNILDYCFRYKSYSFDDLHRYLNEKIAEIFPGEGVSIRTLRDDIKLFRDKKNGFGAPLPNGTIYCYEDREFSIATKPLLENESYIIKSAQQLLERFENHPKYDKLSEALFKFQDGEESDDNSSILFYDHNEEYRGISLLKPIYHAIKNKKVLQIKYKAFQSTKIFNYEFHPHALKQYNRRWFVFGYNKTENIDYWNVPLDERLNEFKILEDVNYLPSKINWFDYFRSMVGVTNSGTYDREKIILKFYNGREKYFKSKPFFPDYEEFFEHEKYDQIWFESIINQELIQQILSYGSDVEVLEPKKLKNELKKHTENLKQYYLND